MSDYEPPKMLPYLTTEQVKEQYGFDPAPFLERTSSGGNFIRNKLVPVGGQILRLWLKPDVEQHPSVKKR